MTQDPTTNRGRVLALLNKGVVIPCPESIEIGPDIDPARIAPGVVVHSGCRISGRSTSIGPGCEIGAEAPATIEDCQLGTRVQLKGGYYSGATFLDDSGTGSGAHVRAGTLLEEGASAAHSVGLKQTIFLPFVTAGSLINFCDALMAGGTGRKNHSEIGSSFIHFNFTPHQDKATASLLGDVPRGVLCAEHPIFLGGQGGLIGPVRIEYGTVIPAGTICRNDILVPDQLFAPAPAAVREPQQYIAGHYRSIERIVRNCRTYIGNIWALRTWYREARYRLMRKDAFSEACWHGAIQRTEEIIRERVHRLKELAEKMPASLEQAEKRTGADLDAEPYAGQRLFLKACHVIGLTLAAGPSDKIGAAEKELFLQEWERIDNNTSYPEAVRSLGPNARAAATGWLQQIVDSYCGDHRG
jgi:hypothetical protein